MPEYRVFFEDKGPENIQADRFEIEDGALVFYENDGDAVTIGDKSHERFLAYNTWEHVNRRRK
jgi:hypothetical protein